MAIYSALETLVYDGRLLVSADKDAELGLDELRFLQKIRMSRKNWRVEAQKEGDVTSDDLADVLANAVFHLITDRALLGAKQAVGRSGSGKPVGGRKGAAKPRGGRPQTNLERLKAADPRYGRWRMSGWRRK
jgi:hypothetical protein